MNRKPTVILHRKRFNVLQTLLFYQVFQIRNTSESPQNKKIPPTGGCSFFIPIKKTYGSKGKQKKTFFPVNYFSKSFRLLLRFLLLTFTRYTPRGTQHSIECLTFASSYLFINQKNTNQQYPVFRKIFLFPRNTPTYFLY